MSTGRLWVAEDDSTCALDVLARPTAAAAGDALEAAFPGDWSVERVGEGATCTDTLCRVSTTGCGARADASDWEGIVLDGDVFGDLADAVPPCAVQSPPATTA